MLFHKPQHWSIFRNHINSRRFFSNLVKPSLCSTLYKSNLKLQQATISNNISVSSHRFYKEHVTNTRNYSTTNINKFKMSSANMQRGMGGRIEDAFAAAKDKGEAAFVSFVTAGYPAAEGKL